MKAMVAELVVLVEGRQQTGDVQGASNSPHAQGNGSEGSSARRRPARASRIGAGADHSVDGEEAFSDF